MDTNNTDAGKCLRELDEFLALHSSLLFLQNEVAYLDLYLAEEDEANVHAPVQGAGQGAVAVQIGGANA